MAAAARLHDPLLPRPPGGLGEGAVLALLAHAALIAALSVGVQWRASTPETFSAELWAAVPRLAAPAAEPAPVEPAPVVAAPPPIPVPAVVPKAPEPEPDIAIERARRERERQRERQRQATEQQRLERERLARAEKERQVDAERRERSERAEQEARERKLAEARLARQREENLKRMLGQAGAAGATAGTGAPGSTGSAAQDAGPGRGYASRLVAHIKPNIVFTDSISGNPAAEVEVRAGATGTIVSRRLVKSSGVKEWDDAVLRAIDRTGSLPRDVDGRVPPLLLIAFRPND